MAIQAGRIARERDRANQEAATAKQVSDFLVGLFKVSDPNEARGNALTAREILESGVANIEKDLAGQPEVQARMMGTMGAIYTGLGLYDRAERLLTQAVATDRRVFGDDDATTLTAVNDLANAYWFQDKYDRAEPLYLTWLSDGGGSWAMSTQTRFVRTTTWLVCSHARSASTRQSVWTGQRSRYSAECSAPSTRTPGSR